MFKKVAILTTTAILGLAISFNALALKPLVEKAEFEDVVWPSFECDGFWIMSEFDINLRETYFTDADGNLIKITVHQKIQNAVYYNSENPEIMYEAHSDVAFSERSYEDGIQVEYRERGVFYHLQVGGEKIIFVAGIGIWNPDDGYFHHGQLIHPYVNEDLERVCAFFSE